MRVLREGRPWIIEHECSGRGNGNQGCGALLGLERADLRYYDGGGYMEQYPAVSFRCPCCGECTDLGADHWPRNATDLVKWSSDWRDGKDA